MTSKLDHLDLHQLDPEMARLFLQGAFYSNQQDMRGFADLFLKAVLIAPSPWSYGRHYLWHVYTDTLGQNPDLANESDKKACLKILRNEKEPVLYRASAAFALAYLFDGGRELIADYYRQVIEIGQSIPAEDVDRPIITNYEDPISTAGRQVKQWVDLAKLNLRLTMNPTETQNDPEYRKVISSTNPRNLTRRPNVLPAEPTPLPLDVRKRLEWGGNSCDCCGRMLEQLGVVRLNCCSFCKNAYFCTRECQRKQWKAGHRSACRKPGEIKALDWMRIRGLQSKPEWNGRLVVARRVDPAKPNRWIVLFSWRQGKGNVICSRQACSYPTSQVDSCSNVC